MCLLLKIFLHLMNYLGHAYLSFENEDILCGNMMGDFVKGKAALEEYPEGIKRGLMLHRHIDTFTDEHPAISAAKQLFRPAYGLYSGALTDIIMDYFIANDAELFPDSVSLDAFAQKVYRQLGTKINYFPDRFLPYYESMVLHNWLVHYRSEEGLKRSLSGLMRRAKKLQEIERAFGLFLLHKADLHHQYTLFIRDIIRFVKIELQGH